ncbi:hypothetical protein ACH5RR_008387 [Cinchona calisaya]|uniref:Uncharacterized protein n=1 Tax=Cinchona calisaya TaxID=153742 RepID=A0ABD3AF26_9GENT
MTTQIKHDGKEELLYEAWKKAQERIFALMAEVESLNARLSQQKGKYVKPQQTATPPFPAYVGGNAQASCSTKPWEKFYPSTGGNRRMNSNPWDNFGPNVGGTNVQPRVSTSNIDPNLISLINDIVRKQINQLEVRENCYLKLISKPYPSWIDKVSFPPGFTQLEFKMFNGKGNPRQHVSYFLSRLSPLGENKHL